jgi:tRNA dimethylallyltransferase
MNDKINNKIIAIVGTTASGKTKLAVQLAYNFNGEIVSADSRQVYRGMDIGTGKDLNEYKIKIRSKNIKIKYHLIDIVSPKTEFNLAKYQKLAYKTIDDILERGKLPIIVGGTGLYVQAIIDGFNLLVGTPDKKNRNELEKKSVDELNKILLNINPGFAKKLNNSEQNNRRRLIRYIEILKDGLKKKVVDKNKKYDALIIGLTLPKEELHKRIFKRLKERLEKENMIEEVKKLRKQGISWKRLISFGLEYKYVSLYLQKKISYEEMEEKLFIAIRQFAKRQMTWLHRWEKQGKVINWTRDIKEIKSIIKKYRAI